MKRLKWVGVVTFAFFIAVTQVYALRPIVHYHDLVAGQGCPGYRDGEFATALFNHPLGLLLSEDGNRMYVADKNNNRIRVIHLDQDNRVETVAGNGTAGSLDGSLLDASFNQPTGLLFLSDGRLLVNDCGNGLLRIVDLKNGRVTTVAGTTKTNAQSEGPALEVSLGSVWNMVYFSAENSVYFTQPSLGTLRKFDMKSGLITGSLLANSPISMPKALCVFQNKLCVSDYATGEVYVLEPTGNSLTGQVTLSAREIGQGKGGVIVALLGAKDDLYALQSLDSDQASDTPIAKISPYQPVHLLSAWGFSTDIQDPYVTPFLRFNVHEPPGFILDSKEDHKFYVASSYLQSVIDFKDYNFERLSDGDVDGGPKGLTDFNYPETKPAHTVRILITGNSIPNWSHEINTPSMVVKRSLTFPKRLELFLNTQAALNDLPVHFEVLVYRRKNTQDFSQFTWPYYEIPEAAENFDADLTILMTSSQTLFVYNSIFERPSNSQGLLVKDFDLEYLSKPESLRFSDPYVKNFYEKAIQKGFIKPPPSGGKTVLPDPGIFLTDGETREEFKKILGKPFGMIREKIEAMKMKNGYKRSFVVCYVPGGMDIGCPEENVRSFFQDICTHYGISFMDTTAPYEALKPTYSPTYESAFGNHFNVYGSELLAQILCHNLLQKPWSNSWDGHR